MGEVVERALLESLAWLLMAINKTDDDEVDPDIAVRWMEDAAVPLGALSRADRTALAELCRERAAEAEDPSMREALQMFLTGFGLDDDEEYE
ncbi:hypothetical protein [Actinomadura sp. 9N407]|uniref:hypothetical protein n=1 Tax=Actinomadura sp. 9N407 TaxID=3375154 RepID=UPI0037A896F7